jgi:aerobic carbon-monoxide dehydrogenase small subunit
MKEVRGAQHTHDGVEINIEVNSVAHTRRVEPRLLLSDFLRHELGLKGTHVGCEHGVCGTCNVLINGATARSCLIFASQLDGAKIETVESLGRVDNLHPLQKAFWEKHGLQCGFCTSGMLMTAKELLDRNPSPTREEIREAISGNLCRCTGYQTIVDAIYSCSSARNRRETASV